MGWQIEERIDNTSNGGEVGTVQIIQDKNDLKKQSIKQRDKRIARPLEDERVKIREERPEEIQRPLRRPLHPKQEQDFSEADRQHKQAMQVIKDRPIPEATQKMIMISY